MLPGRTATASPALGGEVVTVEEDTRWGEIARTKREGIGGWRRSLRRGGGRGRGRGGVVSAWKLRELRGDPIGAVAVDAVRAFGIGGVVVAVQSGRDEGAAVPRAGGGEEESEDGGGHDRTEEEGEREGEGRGRGEGGI